MIGRVILSFFWVVLAPVVLSFSYMVAFNPPFSVGQLILVPVIYFLYGAAFWSLTKPVDKILAPHHGRRDKVRILALIFVCVATSTFFPKTSVLTPEQRVNAPPFIAEWDNQEKSVVYGKPFGMYYVFSQETFCCGKATLMPFGIFMNILVLAILARVLGFLVAGTRILMTRTN